VHEENEMDVFDIGGLEWEPVRTEITNGVLGKTLMAGRTTVVLTRVVPGGRFRMHKDKYGHLFYFLRGMGKVVVEGKETEAREGIVVRIAPGESHSYENTGTEDLMLISMNLPAQT
jgi:mannose-6-phosphate isomerase-like protein (cupin superfamily)